MTIRSFKMPSSVARTFSSRIRSASSNGFQSPAFADIRSWFCIPLVASDYVFGLLSLGSSEPSRFTREHLRLAKSLALSAAVAIQNARLYERAEIYAFELELKLKELKETQSALEQTQTRSRGTGT